MTSLNGENFFFFNEDCSELHILPNSIEHAYLAILNDDLKSAKIVFSGIESPRAVWGKVLVSILEGYMPEYPSYFGIRNFLEIDLNFLLRNNKIDYVEQFLGALDTLAIINQETFKFTAKAMMVNRLYTSALKYMEKSKEIFYNDPELHYMYAKFYMDIGRYKEAYASITECLNFLPDYYPAQVIKEKIEEMCF